MKKETLQKRIDTHLSTKKRKVYKCFECVIEALKHSKHKIHPNIWTRSGRFYNLKSNMKNLEHGLTLLGVDYITGNDAPRGGREGDFVKITPKGLSQIKQWVLAQELLEKEKQKTLQKEEDRKNEQAAYLARVLNPLPNETYIETRKRLINTLKAMFGGNEIIVEPSVLHRAVKMIRKKEEYVRMDEFVKIVNKVADEYHLRERLTDED